MKQSAAVTQQDLTARAEQLVPRLRERGAESDRLGQLPEATIADFEEGGFLGAMMPKEVGGGEIDLRTFASIVRSFARGDASAGWIGGFLISHSWLIAKFGAEARDEIFAGRTWVPAAAAAAPPGRAERVAGGYEITGRWRFASGIMHSEWVVLMAVGDEGPLSCAVPVHEVKIHKTWDVPGMKGTGSNDVEAIRLFVPHHRALGLDEASGADCPGGRLNDYPLLRYPMHRVLPMIHPIVAVGTADAALELFRENIGNRVRPQTGGLLADEATVRQVYGEAAQLVRTAGLVLDDALDRIVEIYDPASPGEATLEKRAELNLAVTYAGVTAFEAVDLLIRASGAGIHRTGNALDRICRDTQVMRNHGMLDWKYQAAVNGGVLLGRGIGDHNATLF
ncbi:acyl-CoA dehydrogenase family protein [Streptomyces mangrovisoli]|uniref:Acyl-CoA dehydrogenase C-terminal domain-containing protein n=1 Tax=Streptomyces mangrovisoli TaxID=1428628 RepID=A0A1J4NSN7_9ACTN|nr:acyl-CoA dehydrogenase family protein [Streptomyces mangrovisoli]OIJ65497.1 hypothetical protein WN71_023410 [Streptomyces mangrovisoli]